MKSWKKGMLFTTAITLALSLVATSHLEAATKKRRSAAKKPAAGGKISSDPNAATLKEASLLKWGAVKPPKRGKNFEFFARGVFMEATPVEGEKDNYTIKILPIEVLQNEQRYITMDAFTNGFTINRELDKKELKDYQVGKVIEVKQYYTTLEEGGQGHAKLVAYAFNQDVMPYPVGPAAYIKKAGLEPEQYLNALRGLEMSGEKSTDDTELKTGVDALASSAPDANVKTKAKELLAQIFSAQPSGQPMLKVVSEPSAPATTATAKKKKKG